MKSLKSIIVLCVFVFASATAYSVIRGTESYNPGVVWHLGGPSTNYAGWAGQTVTRSQIEHELQLMQADGYTHVLLNGNVPGAIYYGNETWNRFEYALDWCDANDMYVVLELNYQYGKNEDREAYYNDPVGSLPGSFQIWVNLAKYHFSLIGVTLGNEVGIGTPSPGEEPDMPNYLAGFRDYLLESHGTLEALNTAWGSSYTDINDVNFPADTDAGYDDLYRFGLIQLGRYYSEIYDHYYKSDPVLGPNLIYGSEGGTIKDAYGDYPASTVVVYDDLMAYYPAWYIKAASETTSKPSFNTEIHLYNDFYNYHESNEITRFRYFTDPLQGEWMNSSFAWGQWNEPLEASIHAETPGVLADVKRLEPQLRLFNTESRQSRLGVLMMRELLYMNYYKQPDYDPDPMTRAYSVMAATGRPWRFVKDLDLPDGQLDDLVLWSSDEMPISTLDAIVALPPSVSVHLVGALPTKTEYGLSLPPAKITELSNRIDSTYSTDNDALNAFVDPELPAYCHNIVDIQRLYWNPAPLGHFWYYLPYPEIEARKAVDTNGNMVVVLINHSENPVTLPTGPSLPWYDAAMMSSAVDITDVTPVTVDFGSPIVLDEFDVHVYQYLPESFALTLSAGSGGAVSPTGGVYDAGTEVGLAAIPDQYYHFDEWSGDTNAITTGTAADAAITITMNSDVGLGAAFGADTTSGGTPHWWLAHANPAWTNDFEAAATNDADGDTILTGDEYISGTGPTNAASPSEKSPVDRPRK